MNDTPAATMTVRERLATWWRRRELWRAIERHRSVRSQAPDRKARARNWPETEGR